MKQIPFTLEGMYHDGTVKDGYEVRLSGNRCLMYRRIRTAEEVAKTIPVYEGSGKWDELPIYAKNDRIACVQAGMDEMS